MERIFALSAKCTICLCPPRAPARPSTSLTLTIAGKTTTLTRAGLKALPQTTVTVHNEYTKADETYTGVLLGDLLAKYGFPVDQSTHQAMLRGFLTAEGTDKYWVLYSLTEIEPTEHNRTVLIALTAGGAAFVLSGNLS